MELTSSPLWMPRGSCERPERVLSAAGRAAAVGGLVFAAALGAILTRPLGFLPAFWPANALLLGIMVRVPTLTSPAGWVGASLGYLAAELVVGGDVPTTFWITAGNLAGVATGVVLFARLTDEDRRLQRPLSVLYLCAISALTGIAVALVGGGAGGALLGKDWETGCAFWFVTQLVSNILLLPVVLTAPPAAELRNLLHQIAGRRKRDRFLYVPAATLVVSTVVSILVGGPGAVIFSVPALLWCALSYNLFTTALLTLLYCAGMKLAVSTGALVVHPMFDYIEETMSLRLGIALLALGPLTAASINAAREQLLRSLEHAVNHDFLTDALARRAFLKLGAGLLDQHPPGGPRPAVLMLDIDHFKSVNDRCGHAAGDQVLVSFATTIARSLRAKDLFGRLGGEEFGVVLPEVGPAAARAVAERIRANVEATPITLPTGGTVRITVSIGLVCPDDESPANLDAWLQAADAALYESKHTGRNRVSAAPGLVPG